MTTAFLSDLHLDASRPEATTLFLDFLEGDARSLDALYILGDLFEAWIGDDSDDPHDARVKWSLRELTDSGVPGYFMRGNRDFLAGEQFGHETGLTVLPDPYVIDLYGTTTLLSHGDTLCIDDIEYQAFRRTVRDPNWQKAFLGKPLDERRAFAAEARAESRRQQAGKAMDIMDVNQVAVVELMQEHDVRRMIHGHTHRPDTHCFTVESNEYTRIVLGDWYEQGSVLWCDESGCRLQSLPLKR